MDWLLRFWNFITEGNRIEIIGAIAGVVAAVAGIVAFFYEKSKKKSELDKQNEDIKSTIIEIVRFKTNEGVNSDEFKAEMAKYDDFLLTQIGFISRQIGVTDDGLYLGMTHWADMQSAEKMGENLYQNPEMAAFFNSTMEKIDQKTLTDEFFEVYSTTKASTIKSNNTR